MTASVEANQREHHFADVEPALWVAAVTSTIAGLIHYTVIPEHLSEWWLYAAFFTVLGIFELVWAALVITGGERLLLLLGLVVNVLVLALWTVTQTSGLPFGRFAWQPEEIGVADVLCCLAELTTVVAVIVACLRTRTAGHGPGAAAASGEGDAADRAVTIPPSGGT